MGIGSFIVYIRINDIHKDIAEDGTRFNNSSKLDHYEKEKQKKVFGLMKNELGRKIMTS